MKCPACSNELKQMKVADVTVDVCEGGCGGVWFDNFELKKFDEPHEADGEQLLNIKEAANVQVDPEKRLNCPKCGDIVMMRHFFSVKKKVMIDQCAQCGGIWLDAGELAEIRSLFNTEAERHQAAEEYFSDVFGKQLEAMAEKQEQRLARTRRVSNIFRFICPSYYIPGKQKGAAF